MIKVSEDTLKKFGATATDFEEKLSAHIAGLTAKSESSGSFDVAIKEVKDAISGMETRLKAMEGKKFTMSEEDITKIVDGAKSAAQTVASQTAAQILAKSGGGKEALGGGNKADDGKEDKVDASDAKAMWDADKNLRTEFVEFKYWETFHKAQADGRVSFNRAAKNEAK